jgi:hypothetical protein
VYVYENKRFYHAWFETTQYGVSFNLYEEEIVIDMNCILFDFSKFSYSRRKGRKVRVSLMAGMLGTLMTFQK